MNYIENVHKVFLFLYVFFVTSTLSNAGRSISLGGLLICLAYSFFKKRAELHYSNLLPNKNYLIIYGIFFATLLLSSAFALTQTALSHTLTYLYWTLPLWLIYFSARFFSVHRLCCNAISLAMISTGIFTINQFLSTPLGTRLAAPLTSPNGLAGILELCLPYIIFYSIYCYNCNYPKKELLFNCVATVIALFSLIFTQSRGGIAGWVIGFIILMIVKVYFKYQENLSFQKKIILFLVGVLFIGATTLSGFTIFHRSYDNERMLMIESSYHMWEDYKAFGVGFDNWQAEYKNYVSPLAKEPTIPMPHNNIAYFFSATGVVGGLGYFIYVFGTLYFLLKKIRSKPSCIYYSATFWAFLAIVIHGMVDSGITNKFSMQILSLGLGMVLSYTDICTSKKQ